MKIDTATSRFYASQSAQASTAARTKSASFAAALSAATAGPKPDAQSAKRIDFTNMTRKEMQTWSNEQIRSGNVSLDDGRPFMAMTMKIPVNGGVGEMQAVDDGERFDFTKKVRRGIEAAVARNDDVTRKMLASAMQSKQQYQGATIGVDTRA